MLEIYLLMQRKYYKEMNAPCKFSRVFIQLKGALVQQGSNFILNFELEIKVRL